MKGRSYSQCRVAAEDSSLHTPKNAHSQRSARKAYSHIMNLPPSSPDAVDTPLIPHLSPSSCDERKRCGMGVVGGRLLMCVWKVVCWCVCFCRGAEQVVMRMTRLGKNPLSAPRTPLPPIPIYPIKFRISLLVPCRKCHRRSACSSGISVPL